jgi:phosphoribosylamine--glycine ligase
MKVLVVGGGGREHAIVWKLSQSSHVEKIFCAPGNAGIASLAECIDTKPTDFDALLDFVKHEWVDLTVVGPEEPLARGIADAFEREGRRILAPSAKAAQLESSKAFCKDFMRRWGIPTAEYRTFSSYTQAEDYVRMKGSPIVVKADGLAAGKGVIVCKTQDEAREALALIMKEKSFGPAGEKVVVEACLEGEEASFMAFVDGKTVLPMVSSQDHKRVFDGDEGLNTGGMGAYSPAPVVTPEMEEKIMRRVMLPTLKGLRRDGIKYRGVLYAGLMIKDGEPQVLEFNCRMGDPETQPILQRLDTDFADVCMAITDERLADMDLRWKPQASVCVVMASGGYPGSYEKGKPIRGLEEAAKLPDTVVFHAGTAFEGDQVVTAGGRVLGVTALGRDIREAKQRAYEAVGKISFEGAHYRHDIADRAIRRTGQ